MAERFFVPIPFLGSTCHRTWSLLRKRKLLWSSGKLGVSSVVMCLLLKETFGHPKAGMCFFFAVRVVMKHLGELHCFGHAMIASGAGVS